MEIPSVMDQKDVHDMFDSPTDIRGFHHYHANTNLGVVVAFINWLLPRHWGVWDKEKIQTDLLKFYHAYHKSKREGKLLRNQLADKLHLKNYELSRATSWEDILPYLSRKDLPLRLSAMKSNQPWKYNSDPNGTLPTIPPKWKFEEKAHAILQQFYELSNQNQTFAYAGPQFAQYIRTQMISPHHQRDYVPLCWQILRALFHRNHTCWNRTP